MRSFRWLAMLLSGSCCLAGLGLAAAPETGTPALRDDPRLQKKVTIQHRFVTLVEGLAAIGKATGVESVTIVHSAADCRCQATPPAHRSGANV